MQLAAESIIEVGRELIEQKKALGHGNYLEWVERELGMSRMTASKMVNVAERFGADVKAPLHLSFEALSALAAPSTPEPVRTEVLERASNGEKVTAREIETLKKKLAKAEDAAKVASQSASVMEGRAQTIERELEGANLARLYAEQDKDRLAAELEDMREEVERMKEPGVITLFNDHHVAPVAEPTPWTEDDTKLLALQSMWGRAGAEAQRRFMEWLQSERSAA
jgi:predicted ribosome quality control (RQC) complex YloA/Tae2 family protein